MLHAELEVVQATLPQPRASEVLVDSLDVQVAAHGVHAHASARAHMHAIPCVCTCPRARPCTWRVSACVMRLGMTWHAARHSSARPWQVEAQLSEARLRLSLLLGTDGEPAPSPPSSPRAHARAQLPPPSEPPQQPAYKTPARTPGTALPSVSFAEGGGDGPSGGGGGGGRRAAAAGGLNFRGNA